MKRSFLLLIGLLVLALMSGCGTKVTIQIGGNSSPDAVPSNNAGGEQSTPLPRSGSGDLSKGLVGYWSFDNCKARDESGHGLDGRIYGRIECIKGVEGKALRLQAQTFVLVPFSQWIDFSPDSSFSIAIWVKNESPEGMWKALVVKSPQSGEWDYGL